MASLDLLSRFKAVFSVNELWKLELKLELIAFTWVWNLEVSLVFGLITSSRDRIDWL